jgi:formylglycine-generating enzyme required for sulfatase activity
MKTQTRLAAIGPLLLAATVQAATPEVTNIRASQRSGTKLIDVYYDLADSDGDPCTIAVTIYDDTTPIPVFSISGDVGPGTMSGANKHIVWNAGQDWNRRYTTKGKARIVADDASTNSPSSAMAFVPAGFANPGVEVYTSGFFMDKFEVSKSLWDSVYSWAVTNGYSFSNAGVAARETHPITGINWYDAVKWCNARSQKEGLTPCYYTDAAQTQLYTAGEPLLDNNWVSWPANGYRLPTRAEWLKAYWGGNYSGFFPWSSYGGSEGNHLSGGLANYYSSGDPYEEDEMWTTPVGYYNGSQVPQGPDMANGYGLYDMTGNAGEWNWDRELSGWYTLPEAQDDNSRGPNTGASGNRCFSGEYANSFSTALSFRRQVYVSAAKKYYYPNNYYYNGNGYSAVGFRCVRSR